MKVKRVQIHRRPGIMSGFGVEFGPGLNVLQGTNGSGKTSLCQTVFEVLWNANGFRGAAEVEIEVDGRAMLATREGGEQTHWSGGQPALPNPSQRRTYFLGIEDLFDAHGDEELAAAVRRELGRGFDLALPLLEERRLGGGSQYAFAARRELQRTQDEHRVVAQAQEALDVEAQELRERREDVGRAREAEHELRRVERALETIRAEHQVQAACAALSDLPAGVERVHPRADRDLEEREGNLARALQGLEEARARLSAVRAKAAASGLPGEGLSDAELSVLEKAGHTLTECGQRRDRAALSLAGAQKRLVELSEEGLPEAKPTKAELRALLNSLKELRVAEARVLEQEAYVDAMTGDEGDELVPHVNAVGRLAGVIVLLGFGLVLGGALFFESGTPGQALLAGGVAVLLLGLMLLKPLGGLRLANNERDVLRRAAVRRLKRDQRIEEEIRATHAAKLTALGLDPNWSGLDLGALEGRLSVRREAQIQVAESAAILEEVEEQELSARQSLARIVDPLRQAMAQDEPRRSGALSEDVAVLMQITQGLRGRETARRLAAESIPEGEARCAAAQREVEAAQRALERFFDENGVPQGDLVGLHERLSARPKWQKLSDTLRDAERRAQEGRAALLGSDELLQEPIDQLEARIRELTDATERRDELVSQVTALELRLEQTTRGHALEDVRKAERNARENLALLRDESLLGAAAEVLLTDVEEEHRREVRDGVVPRASRAFARFTDGEFSLEAPLLSTKEDATQMALGCVVRSSETGLSVAPSSLSNGTRAQLLLALRVALAEELEGPDPLPLFLDEVLATSDPRRLEAVIKSLAELVLSGRQIVLLTADPVIAARVVDALGVDGAGVRVVDVDAARARDVMILTAEELVPTPMRSDPDPADFKRAEDYAEALGVPPVDPFAQAIALHPFHVLRDSLGVVRTLRQNHLDSVGRALLAIDDDLPHGLSQGEAELLRRRCRLAQAFLTAWQVGRTPALTAEFLRAGALRRSEKYMGRVLDVASDLGWDGKALVSALLARSDPRLKGFRQNIAEELRAEFETAGLWTEAAPLDGQELQRDALERAAAAGLQVDPQELEQLVSWLIGWMLP